VKAGSGGKKVPKIPDRVTPRAILADRSGMNDRRVYLGAWCDVGPEQGCTTLTPNANAARTMGIEPLSIETLARQILGGERITDEQQGRGDVPREAQTGAQRQGERRPFWSRLFGRGKAR
jgi:hypothetical protein